MSSKKSIMEGLALGVLLSLLSIFLLSVPDMMLLGAFSLILVFISAWLTSSPRAGAIFGLFALIGESVTDFAYFLLGQGMQVSLVPYAVGFILFVGRIPMFPSLGYLGGYLGEQYFADEKPRIKREKNRENRLRGHVSRKARE